MSLTKDALELIQSTAIEADEARAAILAGTDTIALPNDYGLHSLEKHRAGRSRFRGKLLTNSIADFVHYAKADDRKGGEVFIDADNLAATAIFNLGTAANPGHGDYTATLKPKMTAAFAALLAVDGSKFDQRSLVDWLEDWGAIIQPYSAAGEEVSVSAAISAVREVTISTKKDDTSALDDFRASKSVFEEVEAKSKIGLPAGFIFTTEPYLGLPPRAFRVRMALLTGSDKPVLTLRIVRRDAETEAIAHDFKALLLRDLDGAARLTIGTFTP